MRRTLYICLMVCLGVLLAAPSASFADVEAPVRFEALDLGDLGDFHGDVAADNNQGWGYWGGREPVVTTDWVVFPFKGKYSFIIEGSSQQLVPEDTDNGIFAEVELRGRFHGENGVKKLADNKGDFQSGEVVILHTRLKADLAAAEWFVDPVEAGTVDPEGVMIIEDDRLLGIIEFDAGMKAQLGVWFTNDEWIPAPPPAKDRNMRLRALEVIPPKGSLAVEADGKATTSWGRLKASR